MYSSRPQRNLAYSAASQNVSRLMALSLRPATSLVGLHFRFQVLATAKPNEIIARGVDGVGSGTQVLRTFCSQGRKSFANRTENPGANLPRLGDTLAGPAWSRIVS